MTIEKRIERIEAILDARGLDWDHPRIEDADELSPDGLPDLRTFAQPNLRWRILEAGEEVQEGDWYADAFYPRQCWPPSKGAWLQVKVDSVKVGEVATSGLVFARPVADEPAKEPEPAWGPKIGDWVLVTRPENWKEWKDILWRDEMHAYDGKVFQVAGAFETLFGHRVKLHGIDWFFHRDWLSPSIKHFAEPPAKDEPPKDEYREPVLPADAGELCEFSIDGNAWTEAKLRGYAGHLWQSVCSEVVGAKHWVHARIKKDA